VYFPAHRRKTEARADSILFRNLCREVEQILTDDTDPATTREILGKLRSLDEPEFWAHGSEGVAVFASMDSFACYRLPMELPTLQVVGPTFHTKPLLRYLQTGLSYYLLVVSLHKVALYDGWGEGLQELPLYDVPGSLEEVIQFSGGEKRAHQRGETRFHHVQGEGGDFQKTDLEKFFREVAKGLARNGLKNSRKPLILAMHKHQQGMFRKVAQLPGLLAEGIDSDAARMAPEDLCAEAKRILEPRFERRLAELKEEYGLAASKGQGSDDLVKVAKAVAAGRVSLLCVETGRRFWGLLDRKSGEIVPGEPRKNAYDVDLFDELAEMALGQGAEVLVLPPPKMPARTGVAAVFRY
jgi:hypothetical protein